MMSKVADDTKPEHIVFVVFKLVIERLTGHIFYGGSIEANQSVLAGIIAVVIVYSIPLVLMVASHFINATTEVVPNTQPISPAPVVTEINIEIEREFWISVENHPSEQMYREYLKKYPEGEFKEIAKARRDAEAKAKRDAEAKAKRDAEAQAKRDAEQNAKEPPQQTSGHYRRYSSGYSQQKSQPSVIAKRNNGWTPQPERFAPPTRE